MAGNRLFQMVYLLLDRGSMTAPEMAKHFEVSVRTIYRDVDILSGAGIPVYTMPGKGGGIAIQENFVLRKSLLSEEEQTHLLMALQGTSVVDTALNAVLLSKLSGAFQKQNMQWIEVDFSEWRPDTKLLFEQIKSAIFQRVRMAFDYSGGKGESVQRLVEPLKLVFKSNAWYLYAYCHLREDYRLFKLTRMRRLSTTAERFDRNAPQHVFEEEKIHAASLVTVTLLFDADMAYQVYDHHAKVERCADGRLRVEAVFPNNGYMYQHLLSFGEKLEVLQPASVREEMKSRLKKMTRKYIT